MPRKSSKVIALVIEDEPDLRKFITLLLSLEGLTVLEAETGERGMEIVCQNHCDLLLLDLRLPGRNGWSVLGEIKENVQLCHIPVIVFSASASTDSKDKALKMGASEYLVKPISAGNLRESITRVLKNAYPANSL